MRGSIGLRRRASTNVGGPCTATARNASPSNRNSTPNVASQMRVAFASMVSNTGCRSPGEAEMICSTSDVAVCRSNASASFFFRSATCVPAFVSFERSLPPRVGLFAPLRAKVTSSAQSLIPVSVASQGSSLSILTESHDKLAAHSITPSAAIRGTKRYGKSFRSSAETSSLRLDVGGPDHLAPFLGFRGDQLAELSRRSRQRRAGEVSETGLHLRVVESRVDLLVELVDDLGRRGLRCAEAVPNTPLVARQETVHGRMSGSASERVAVVTASARSLPALRYSITEGMEVNVTCTCPPSKSVSAGATPR